MPPSRPTWCGCSPSPISGHRVRFTTRWTVYQVRRPGATPHNLPNRHKSTRWPCVLHMALFVGLLGLGWTAVEVGGRSAAPGAWAMVPLLLAVLVRCGTIPAHCWVTDWFEHATFGIGILLVAPLGGVYTAVRLVLPIAPEWVLHGLAYASLITAVYAAGMGVIQSEVRRLFAYLFLSHASLVLVGLELDTVISLTG